MSNNSIFDFDDLPIGVALLCSTDRKIGFNASWTSPAGNQATAIFNVTSGASVLQMERMASPIQAHHNGIWHCEIPDFSYDIQYIYVGLYSQGKTLHLYDNSVLTAYTMYRNSLDTSLKTYLISYVSTWCSALPQGDKKCHLTTCLFSVLYHPEEGLSTMKSIHV